MSTAEHSSESKSISILVNLGLLALVAVIFALCMAFGATGSSEEVFVGTDTAAVESIEGSHPNYEPWFDQLYVPPSAEIESGLFALQAAVGAGVFGYAIGALRRRRSSADGWSTGSGEGAP